jgi:hypothetical protein
MGFIWECIVISLMGILGLIFLMVISFLLFFMMFLISHITNKIRNPHVPKKQKYDGRPIIIEGGKKKNE